MHFNYYLLFFIVQFGLIHGFCIYNKSDKFEFFIHQEPVNAGGNWLSRFRRDKLDHGESGCCPYTDYDCNNTRKKEAILLFTFKSSFLGDDKQIFTLNAPAGGWIEFSGDTDADGVPTIKVFEADGTPFRYEYQINNRESMLY